MRTLRILTLPLLLLAASTAQAESPYQQEVSGAPRVLARVVGANREVARSRSGQSLSPVRLSAFIPGQGRVRFEITQMRSRDWTASLNTPAGLINDPLDVVLLRGRRLIRRGGSSPWAPAAASIYDHDGVPHLHVFFSGRRRSSLTRHYELVAPLLSGSSLTARVRSAPASLLLTKRCGMDEALHAPGGLTEASTLSGQPPTAPAALRTIELRTVADTLYSGLYGASTNAVIASVVNAADAVYSAELDLTFSIVNQVAGFIQSSSNANTILSNFEGFTQTLPGVDANVLFSGRDFEGDVIGLAYVGVLCRFPTVNQAIIQNLATPLSWITFAHEVGHNLNATHTTAGSIMAGIASVSHTSFSTFSRGEISSFVASHGSCLATADGTPAPTPVPTATPTPTGGGGEIGEDPPPMPTIALRATVGNNVVRVNAVYTGDIPSGTTHWLLVSPDLSFPQSKTEHIAISPTTGGLFGESADLGGFSARSERQRRADGSRSRQRTSFLYLQARAELRGEKFTAAAASKVVRVNLKRLTGRERRSLRELSRVFSGALG